MVDVIEMARRGHARARSGVNGKVHCKSSVLDDDGPHLAGMGHARRFVRDHGENVRHYWSWRKWLIWDGRRCRLDNNGEADACAKAPVTGMYTEAMAQVKDCDFSQTT